MIDVNDDISWRCTFPLIQRATDLSFKKAKNSSFKVMLPNGKSISRSYFNFLGNRITANLPLGKIFESIMSIVLKLTL